MNQSWIKYLPAALRKKIEGRTYLQNVVANTGWQFADSILRMGVGLLVGVWVARYLGPEQFGMLNYALAFVALFAAFSTLGLDDIVVRDVIRNPASKEETLGTAFFLKLVGSAIAFSAIMGSILLLNPDDSLNHWLVGIIASGTFFQSLGVIELWFNSQVQAKYIVFARSSAFILTSVIKVSFILFKAPLIAFAWVATFELAVGAAGLAIAYRSRGHYFRAWRASLKMAKSLLSDSWPLFFSGIVIMVYMRIDQVMLGEMTGSAEVGIYSAAVRLAEPWAFFPMLIFWSVYPAIVIARETNEKLLYERLQKLYNFMTLSAYTIAIPISFFSDWLIGTLFGEVYARAGNMLALLIWTNVFTNLEIARSSFLSSMNWTKLHFVTVFLGCLLNIGLNLLLIPEHGGMGAVVASLISYWFAAHGSCFLFRPLFRTGIMLTKAILYPKIW
jgi:O-antigen/teichoic acid export membrane protein